MTQPQAQPDMQKVAVALQQALAEKVANYEGMVAMLKVQYDTQIEELSAEVERLRSENAELAQKKAGK